MGVTRAETPFAYPVVQATYGRYLMDSPNKTGVTSSPYVPNTFVIIHFHSHTKKTFIFFLFIQIYIYFLEMTVETRSIPVEAFCLKNSVRVLLPSLQPAFHIPSPSFISSPKFYTKSVLYTDPVLAYCNNKLKQLRTCLYPLREACFLYLLSSVDKMKCREL